MRLLFVAPSFAPRGASPAVRTVHLCKYLRQLGHELAVLTYEESAQLLFSPADASLAAKVPDDVLVRRIPAGLLHRWTGRAQRRGADARRLKARGTRSLASSLIVPDPHIAAYRAFRRAAADIIREWNPDALLTFSYPFTTVLVGAALKRAHPGLTWIADYGDPWTGSPVTELNLPAWRRRLDRRLEARALRRADLVTVTTEPTARLYTRQFPFLADRLHVASMGYDPEDAAAIPAAPRATEDHGKLLLVHAGRLYREARDPDPFFAALARMRGEDPDLARRLKVVLLGEVEDSIRSVIEGSAARDLVDFHGWVTVGESLARMKTADHLLLFGNRGEMQIPGKVFQYMGAGRPIFMIFESESDPTVGVVKRYGYAAAVHNSVDAIEPAIWEVLAAGRTPETGGSCADFEWPALASSLADAIARARGEKAAHSREVRIINAGIRPFRPGDAARVASLHRQAIPRGFLSELGDGFLHRLYGFIARAEGSRVLVAVDAADRCVGFIAGSVDTRRCYREVLRRGGLSLLAGLLPGVLRPSVLARIFQTILYPLRGTREATTSGGAVERDRVAPAELLAVAVDRSARGRGVGRLLVAALEDFYRNSGYEGSYRVVTDTADPRSNAFYTALGFHPAGTFRHHGRAMSRYIKAVPAEAAETARG